MIGIGLMYLQKHFWNESRIFTSQHQCLHDIKINAKHLLTLKNKQDKDVGLPVFKFAKRFEITKPKNH